MKKIVFRDQLEGANFSVTDLIKTHQLVQIVVLCNSDISDERSKTIIIKNRSPK